MKWFGPHPLSIGHKHPVTVSNVELYIFKLFEILDNALTLFSINLNLAQSVMMKMMMKSVIAVIIMHCLSSSFGFLKKTLELACKVADVYLLVMI